MAEQNQDEFQTPLTTMKVKKLKSTCRMLGLPITGVKKDLIRRLRLAFASDQNNDDDGSAIEDNSNDDNRSEPEKTESKKVNKQKKTKKKKKKQVESESESSDDSEQSSDDDDDDDQEQSGRSKRPIAFKDVDESFARFHGNKNESAKRWLTDFEEFADTLNWSDIEKVLYAKRLLKGEARLFIDKDLKPRKWSKFKKGLIREFDPKVNSATVHKQLAMRKKKESESFRQYMYDMIDIASQADLDDEAVILYIVDGICDSKPNKAILYECRTIERLKRKMKIYEMMQPADQAATASSNTKKESNNSSSSRSNNNNNKRVDEKNERRHCFSCGDKTHEKHECPNAAKGPKCFKCNSFGHISRECTEKKIVQPEEAAANVILCGASNRMYKTVKLNGIEFQGLIDTGSDVTIIKQKVFTQHKVGHSERCDMVLRGLQSKTTVVGVFGAIVEIDSEEYDVRCHIFDGDMFPDLIIGRNVLEQAEIHISNDGVTMKKVADEKAQNSDDPFGNCMYVDDAKRELSDLSHINDNKIAEKDGQEDESMSAGMRAMHTQLIESYTVRNGLLSKQTNEDIQIVVLPPKQYDIIRRTHGRDHFKLTKRGEMIEREFFIPQVKKKIKHAEFDVEDQVAMQFDAGLKLHPKHLEPDETIERIHDEVFIIRGG